jgi:anaerobic ribonucleoside-triphosphate reductase
MELEKLADGLDEDKLKYRMYRLLELYRDKRYFLPISKKFVELVNLKRANTEIESEYVKVRFTKRREKPQIRTMSIYEYDALIREGSATLVKRYD